MSRRLKMGMVGGGRDAFIGAVHRMAAWLDGKIDLVAGAFSSNAEKSKLSGSDLSLDSKRVYANYQTMAEEEGKLPIGERIDFVSIVTPNYVHFPVAKAFLESGFNVVCDKPMVKEAREMVRRGDLGKILKVVAEYPQGWLLHLLEAEGHKGASWRTNPEQAGASSCIGDIGTHAENLEIGRA